jgi:hypothetical protein
LNSRDKETGKKKARKGEVPSRKGTKKLEPP